VAFGLLAAFAETIGKLEADELWAIEASTVELLASVLVSAALTEPLTGGSTTATANLYRISQVIEAQLANPDLAPAHIADACGISTRYLQKLFKSAGTSFRQIVRKRRLERCRADLTNPMYAHLSISDVAFRWGFNDAAHFSRTFHEQWGVSPRECRRENGGGIDLPRRFQRGWADGEEESLAAGGMPSGRGIVQPRQLDFSPGVTLRAPRAARLAVPRCASTGGKPRHHHLAASPETVHLGFFSKMLAPVLEVNSRDTVTIETLSPFDPGIERIVQGARESQTIGPRGFSGCGPSDTGSGLGETLQICTGPIRIRDAAPGDVVELRILDIRLGKGSGHEPTYGINVAAPWGFHYNQLLDEPKRREVMTLFDVQACEDGACARAVRSVRTGPAGADRRVDRCDPLSGIAIPLRPHFGVVGLAPKEASVVDSVPPAYFGGNLDNWRATKGTSVYLPASVPGGLLSIGDPHLAQGDGQISGTAIEYPLVGDFEIVLHKKQDTTDQKVRDLNYPLVETPREWVIHGFSFPNYLAELGDKAQSNIYQTSSLDFAMEDAFRKTRRFLMKVMGLSEDEAISLMSVAVDFGITQVVNGNWCVHALVSKALFAGRA
jgi:acetamidase/formamidase/AraC-like DNA-binding protein